MMNFIQKKFIKVHLGDKKIRSHIDAVHAQPPKADKFTDDIVAGVVNRINCSGIIATVSRTKIDLNRPRNEHNRDAIDEYRQTIKDILAHISILEENNTLSRHYLHLAIHGMRDNEDNGIEIGTLYGKSCSPEIKDWLIEEIGKNIKRLQIDRRFPGDSSKSVHRCGDEVSDPKYFGYGVNFNTLQIEISRTLREKHQGELIEIFCRLIEDFNKKF